MKTSSAMLSATATASKPQFRAATTERIWTWLANLVLSLIIVLPFGATSVLPLLDYPNHLARMGILAAHGSDPAFNAMYRVHWAFFPNLAMDLVVPQLARFLPVGAAGSLFAAAAALLCVSGTIALHRALFRPALWPYVSALTAYNFVLTNGFLNYLFGLGVALWATALWIGLTPRRLPIRAGFALLAGLACLLCHIFAFAILALLCGSIELVRLWRLLHESGGARWRDLPAQLVRSALSLLAATVLPFLTYKLLGPSNTYSSPDQGRLFLEQLAHNGFLAEPKMRLLWLIGTVGAPNRELDLIAALVLAAIPLLALVRRSLFLRPEPLLAAAILFVAFLVLPSTAIDNGMVYPRLALPVVLLCIAGVRPSLPRPLGTAAAVAVLALTLFHAAGTASVWSRQQPVLQDLRSVTREVAPCSRVLATRDGGNAWMVERDEPAVSRIFYNGVAYANLPAWVMMERRAYWPMIFAQTGKQPLEVRPPFDRMQQNDGYLPLTQQLRLGPDSAGIAGSNRWPSQLTDWRHRYDYVLILNQHPETALPSELQLRARSGFAALYRVTTATPHAACGG